MKATTALALMATLLLSVAQADPNAACYYPDSSFAPGYFPCIAYNAAYSACCPAGWSCFSNALCIATTPSASFPNLTYGAVERAACTAPKWASDVCGSICLDPANQDGQLIACSDETFCCQHDFDAGKCSCAAGGGAQTIRPGVFQTIIQVSDATFSGTPSISIATTSAKVTLSTTTNPPTTTTTKPSTSTSSATGTASPTSTGEPESGGSSSSNGRTIGIAVGAAVGGLLLLLLGALAFWFWYWKPRHPAAEKDVSPNYEEDDNRYGGETGNGHIPDDLMEDDADGPRYAGDRGLGRRVGI